MSYQKIFFTNVVSLAASKGMSHQDLAEKANLSSSLMSAITRGQGNPTLETMASIASSLGVPLGYLLEHHDLDSEDSELDSLPANYEQVTVILPKYRAFIVKKWNAEALKALAKK